MAGDHTALTVLSSRVDATDADIRDLLRRVAELASTPRGADRGARPRTFAILGDLVVPDAPTADATVVAHDRIGRLAVRLAIDKTLCIGTSRAVRATYQGAVMEGSWGDEALAVADIGAALELIGSDESWLPRGGDVVLIAGSVGDRAVLADAFRDRSGAELHEIGPGEVGSGAVGSCDADADATSGRADADVTEQDEKGKIQR
ncbi:hypothetical protein [Gordonia soli]|uniref:UDP-N-acetylmuramoyl-tripeptide--D-alanyl-D-alanine ligase n=1 Tax=Gordonia soli NBRC 108243 TaxID=1223545 RepID=M0QMN2_9ACTN|nr:hypothetical protein [Gordonia soli]GAC69551.1 hypothetical protein GS4_25_01240 [Gordonia soli NBRC 108243]